LSRSTLGTPLRRRAFPLAVALLVGAAVLSGCGATTTSSQGADTAGGQELFVESCGSCHVMADAGTQGDVGPNLDDAFGYAREQGFDDSTILEVVNEQMEIPGPPMPEFDDPDTKEYLPEEDRISIAAYVAACAGVIDGEKVSEQCTGGTGIDQGETDPKAIFTGAGCGACHVFADAGTTGAVGPNLDDSDISLEAAIEQITNGGGGMPPYEGKLTEEQIRLLAEYIIGSGG
jgi:mono/diheme cytochrome c family protein